MKIRNLAIAAVFGTILAAQPAIAASVELAFDDLNLATPQGQKELEARLTRAAKEACSADTISTGTILRSKAEAACVKETRARLKKQVAILIQERAVGG